jgi:hypothetical protein
MKIKTRVASVPSMFLNAIPYNAPRTSQKNRKTKLVDQVNEIIRDISLYRERHARPGSSNADENTAANKLLEDSLLASIWKANNAK